MIHLCKSSVTFVFTPLFPHRQWSADTAKAHWCISLFGNAVIIVILVIVVITVIKIIKIVIITSSKWNVAWRWFNHWPLSPTSFWSRKLSKAWKAWPIGQAGFGGANDNTPSSRLKHGKILHIVDTDTEIVKNTSTFIKCISMRVLILLKKAFTLYLLLQYFSNKFQTFQWFDTVDSDEERKIHQAD